MCDYKIQIMTNKFDGQCRKHICNRIYFTRCFPPKSREVTCNVCKQGNLLGYIYGTSNRACLGLLYFLRCRLSPFSSWEWMQNTILSPCLHSALWLGGCKFKENLCAQLETKITVLIVLLDSFSFWAWCVFMSNVWECMVYVRHTQTGFSLP